MLKPQICTKPRLIGYFYSGFLNSKFLDRRIIATIWRNVEFHVQSQICIRQNFLMQNFQTEKAIKAPDNKGEWFPDFQRMIANRQRNDCHTQSHIQIQLQHLQLLRNFSRRPFQLIEQRESGSQKQHICCYSTYSYLWSPFLF